MRSHPGRPNSDNTEPGLRVGSDQRSMEPGGVLSRKPIADAPDTAAIITQQRTPHDRRRTKLTDASLGAGTMVAALVLWELLARTDVLPSAAFPSASDVAIRLLSLIPTAAFWSAVWETVSIAGLGLAIVISIAVPVGMAIGRSRWFERSTLLVVEFLKPIPPVALLPLALLFWGPSPAMKLFLVCIGAVWPLLVQVAYGARGLDKTQMDLAHSYRLGRWRSIFHIVLPNITPFALTGLRVSSTIAIIIAVVAELLGGAPGLGQQVVLAQNSSDLPLMYAYIITTGLLGLAVNGLFVLLGKPLLFWHPSERSKED